LLSAQELRHRDDIVFLFVGGGSEVEKVQLFARSHALRNIRWLPYQPQAELSALLSAADLHVVVMGESFGGIVHPSKIYNILKVRAPFLFIGPEACFISDIVAAGPREVAMHAQHGHMEEVVTFISSQADRHLEDRSRAIASGYDFSITPGFSRFIAHIEAVNPQPSPARFEAAGTSADIV